MNEKLKFMWLNLIQFMVYLNDSMACNAVVLIGDKNKGVVVMRPEHHPMLDDAKTLIRANIAGYDPKVLWGDWFTVDTWDAVILNYKEEPSVDFIFIADRSTPLLCPQTQAAHDWVKDNVALSPWQSHRRIAVEPQRVGELLDGIKEDGLSVDEEG